MALQGVTIPQLGGGSSLSRQPPPWGQGRGVVAWRGLDSWALLGCPSLPASRTHKPPVPLQSHREPKKEGSPSGDRPPFTVLALGFLLGGGSGMR